MNYNVKATAKARAASIPWAIRRQSMARLWSAIGLILMSAAAQAQDSSSVAAAFLHALMVEMDLTRAYREYADPNFIEHNPEIGNGYAAKIAYFAERQARNPNGPGPGSWANVIDHVIVSSDLFSVHRHVFMNAADRGRVFVDIWRVAGGKIVEHWDVIQAVPDSAPDSVSMWCGLGSTYADARALHETVQRPACGAADPAAKGEASIALVRDYIRHLSRGEHVRAGRRFLAANYIEHAPGVDDGHSAFPGTIVRILVQGNLVLVHRHETPQGDEGDSVAADIFRISGQRITEHWEVRQAVPLKTVSGNTVW
jgi:predicted SnoaL-like aldol condensation-catalyzing enzyme